MYVHTKMTFQLRWGSNINFQLSPEERIDENLYKIDQKFSGHSVFLISLHCPCSLTPSLYFNSFHIIRNHRKSAYFFILEPSTNSLFMKLINGISSTITINGSLLQLVPCVMTKFQLCTLVHQFWDIIELNPPRLNHCIMSPKGHH